MSATAVVVAVGAGAIGCGAAAEAVLEGRIAATRFPLGSAVAVAAVILLLLLLAVTVVGVMVMVIVVQMAVVRIVDIVAAPDAAHDALEEARMRLRPGGLLHLCPHDESNLRLID